MARWEQWRSRSPTGERGPAVVGAACYGLSSTLLWALSQGRIAVLVMLAVAPVLAGRLHAGFTSQPFYRKALFDQQRGVSSGSRGNAFFSIVEPIPIKRTRRTGRRFISQSPIAMP